MAFEESNTYSAFSAYVLKQSKQYAENADYFKELLESSRDKIRPAYAAKFEAIAIASLAAAEAYAKLAKASPSEETAARFVANQCAMEVEKAKAAFAEVV
jgi:hypothetical protein